jgi:hypothetical protein
MTDVEKLRAAIDRLRAGIEHCGEDGRPHNHFTADAGFIGCLTPDLAEAMAWVLESIDDVVSAPADEDVSHHIKTCRDAAQALTEVVLGSEREGENDG